MLIKEMVPCVSLAFVRTVSMGVGPGELQRVTGVGGRAGTGVRQTGA